MKGAVTFVALVLCGVPVAAETLEGKGKRITLLHIQTADVTRKAVEAAVRRFEAATGARVNVQAVKNDPFKQKIAVELPSARPPDVFHTWGGGGLAGFARKGLVEPLPADFPVEGISPQALDFCEVDGRLYAVPVDVSIVGFWYRKSVFRKHGITPPKTLGGWMLVCDRLKSAGLTPIALGNIEQWPGAFYFDYLVLRLGGADDYLARSNRAGAPATTPAARLATAIVRGLSLDSVFAGGFGGMNYDQSRAMFFKGEAAMTLMGSWLLSYAVQEEGEIVPDLGVFAFPRIGPGRDADALLGGVNAAYAVAARSKHKRLAFRLLRFLSDEAAAKDWAKTARIPARKVEVAKAVPALANAMGLLARAPRIQLYFDQALSPAVAERHKSHTQSLFVTRAASPWPRILVGLVAVVVLIELARLLRGAFRSGEPEPG